MKHSSAKEVEVRVKRTFLARKKPTNSLIDGQVKISIRFHQLKVRFKQLSVELNLFNNQSSDDRHIRCQRIGTRLHIFILIGSSIILALYSSLTQEIHHETILNPSETQYTTLAQVYGDCVVCPCSTFSVSHETFISIKPIYHHICSGDFVSSAWINFLLRSQFIDFVLYSDYH
ncbi:unnamed protein product, partial [Rotaria sp. Silwood2]